MHILIISQYFWPETFPINDIALGLKNKGYEVTVLTGLPNYPAGKLFPKYKFWGPFKETYQGINIVRVPIVTRGSSKGVRLAINYFSFVLCASLAILFKLRKKFDVSYVYAISPITQALPAIFLKALTGTPVVVNIQDLWPESLTATGAVKSKRIIELIKKLVSYIYKKSDALVVQSKGFLKPVLSFGVSEEKTYYLPNTLPLLFKKIDSVQNKKIVSVKFPKGFCIVFAGNIGAAQDFPTILQAAEILKSYSDIHFVIFGTGREYASVKKEVERCGLTETFHLFGQHPIDDMPTYFSMADVLLVGLRPDPIFALTIPAKLQAYLACGRPIVACLDGVGAEIINEAKAGYVANAGNPLALAEAIKRIYLLPKESRETMGMNGYLFYNAHFNYDKVMDRLDEILHKVAQG